jgi:hypothetical protein
MICHLRGLATNKHTTNPCSVPIHHHCDTPRVFVHSMDFKWKSDMPAPESVAGSAALPIEALNSPPPKKARTCTHHKAPAADSPGSAVMTVSLPTACVSLMSSKTSKAFTSYLLAQIELQSQALQVKNGTRQFSGGWTGEEGTGGRWSQQCEDSAKHQCSFLSEFVQKWCAQRWIRVSLL